jgi:hypothetical protein
MSKRKAELLAEYIYSRQWDRDNLYWRTGSWDTEDADCKKTWISQSQEYIDFLDQV